MVSMTVSSGLVDQEHGGFDAVLSALTEGLKGSDRISHEVLGAVLQELAIAAPEGLLRSDLHGRVGPGDGTTYSAATLSKALAVLEAHKLVSRRASYAGPRGGRPPERYTLGSQQWAMLGIHFRLEHGKPRGLTCTLRDLSGQLILTESYALTDRDANWSADEAAKEIADRANELIRAWKNAGSADQQILGVGVEVPGHVHHGEILQTYHTGYRTPRGPAGFNARSGAAPLARQVRDLLDDDLTVVLDNDVNLIALRETYRADIRARPRDGAVVAVFDEGVGAGLLVGGHVHRGHNGAAGELGHNPVFTEPGEPRIPVPASSTVPGSRHTADHPKFSDTCSCGGPSHIDCYATPVRLTGQHGRPLSDFQSLARNPAFDGNGGLTDVGRTFWKGGVALGHGIVSLLNSHNPGWLLILLPHTLAEVTLDEGDLGDGTAARLYRQAIETVVSEQAFSSTAEDARRGGQWLEVRALADDRAVGAEKAARNAAIRVLDEFIAHALKRDSCVKTQTVEPQQVRRPEKSDRELLKEQRLDLEKELRAILVHSDPEGLIHAGAPPNEYATEESELLRQVMQGEVSCDTVRAFWFKMFGKSSRLLADSGRFRDLVRELVALQGRRRPVSEQPVHAML